MLALNTLLLIYETALNFLYVITHHSSGILVEWAKWYRLRRSYERHSCFPEYHLRRHHYVPLGRQCYLLVLVYGLFRFANTPPNLNRCGVNASCAMSRSIDATRCARAVFYAHFSTIPYRIVRRTLTGKYMGRRRDFCLVALRGVRPR